jgi:adenylate kinase family enzyme
MVITGKPLSGKKSIAIRLAEEFGFHILTPQNLVQEALAYAGRPEPGSLEALNINQQAVEGIVAGCRHLSRIQELGTQALGILDEGAVLTDEIYVELIVAKLKSLSFNDSHPGWLLLGFPNTVSEARLLEKAMSGFTEPKERPATDAQKRKKKAAICFPPKPQPPPAFVREAGALDCYVHVEASCETAVLRSAGRKLDIASNTVYTVRWRGRTFGAGVLVASWSGSVLRFRNTPKSRRI